MLPLRFFRTSLPSSAGCHHATRSWLRLRRAAWRLTRAGAASPRRALAPRVSQNSLSMRVTEASGAFKGVKKKSMEIKTQHVILLWHLAWVHMPGELQVPRIACHRERLSFDGPQHPISDSRPLKHKSMSSRGGRCLTRSAAIRNLFCRFHHVHHHSPDRTVVPVL